MREKRWENGVPLRENDVHGKEADLEIENQVGVKGKGEEGVGKVRKSVKGDGSVSGGEGQRNEQ